MLLQLERAPNGSPQQKSSKWVTYLSIENSNWVSTSADRTPKAVSSGAEAAKCVSGVETKSLFLIYFTFDENFMWVVDLCMLMFVNCCKWTPCSLICFPVCLPMRSRVSTKSMNLEYIFVCFKRNFKRYEYNAEKHPKVGSKF